ncbi:Uncharacterised protein [Escherichia coli]|nr:Uncharacterised protein [Escherichia coli]
MVNYRLISLALTVVFSHLADGVLLRLQQCPQAGVLMSK